MALREALARPSTFIGRLAALQGEDRKADRHWDPISILLTGSRPESDPGGTAAYINFEPALSLFLAVVHLWED